MSAVEWLSLIGVSLLLIAVLLYNLPTGCPECPHCRRDKEDRQRRQKELQADLAKRWGLDPPEDRKK